eukprot:3682-Eustigmatos_ZCMA.PRE.1
MERVPPQHDSTLIPTDDSSGPFSSAFYAPGATAERTSDTVSGAWEQSYRWRGHKTSGHLRMSSAVHGPYFLHR